MRASWFSITFSLALVALTEAGVNADRYAVLPRQNSSPSPTPSADSSSVTTPASSSHGSDQSSAGTPSSPTSAAASSSGAPSDSSVAAKTTSSSSTTGKPTSSTSNTAIVVTPTPIANMTLLSHNGTANGDPGALPISPRITPALSVAGAILLLSGLFYTLIGIKTKWLHVFFSAAYVASLGITILIVYVMNTPISDAKQGAYFAAACVSGLIFGGGSVIFADVTEGLGCLLGGFCLSMWLMVLTPGGLLSSTTGKAIFISCFTAAGFALYISHYTRPYGLIGCTSFAGATAIVLGIDCFSRAGLKEFWLYIWNLNSDLFPYHDTQKYPITRGIRVEVAGIILICLLGIMSQIKVWNIIKKRREERVAGQRLDQERQDQAEEELGKRLEEGNEQERATWEAIYGGPGRTKGRQIDSGIGTDESESIRKGSASVVDTAGVRTPGGGSIEMNYLNPMKASGRNGSQVGDNGHRDARVTVRVAADEAYELPPMDFGGSVASDKDISQRISRGSSINESPPEGLKKVPSVVSVKELSRSASLEVIATENPNQPKIVPLPFNIPDEDSRSDHDGSSIATFAASDHLQVPSSNRRSQGSLRKTLSRKPKSNSWVVSASEEALMIPHADDDQASSLAATIDGCSDRDSDDERETSNSARMSDFDYGSRENSRERNTPMDDTLVPTVPDGQSVGPDWFKSAESRGGGSAEGVEPSVSGAHDMSSGAPRLTDSPFRKQDLNVDEEPPDMTQAAKSAVGSQGSGKRPTRTSLTGQLPEGGSKVVMAYRTNEWAKHLERAEMPELDELNVAKTPRGLASAQVKEAAAPVLIRELQQTPLTAEPGPIMSPPRTGSTGPSQYLPTGLAYAFNKYSPRKHTSQQPKGATVLPPSAKSAEWPLSQQSLQNGQGQDESPYAGLGKPGSSQLSLATNRGLRSSSTPLATQPLVESPIEEGIEASFPSRFTPSSTHLMAKRDTMVQNKFSSTSLNRKTSFSPPVQPSDASSIRSDHLEPHEEDDLTLSQRRSLLRQQQALLTPQPHISRPSLTPHRSSSTPTPAPNHHDTTVAAWRSSLRQDAKSPSTQAHFQQHNLMDARRADMLNDKRRTSQGQEQKEKEAGMRESVMDRGMRRGGMLDAHRDAMRRMQGRANRGLGGE